jgi:superfamily I DNA/RNA helicase
MESSESHAVLDALDFHLALDQSLLDGKQREAVRLIARGKGPLLIRGSAGTGKSAVLFHGLQGSVQQLPLFGSEVRILFVTYMKALSSVHDLLLERLGVPAGFPGKVEVFNWDQISCCYGSIPLRGILDGNDGERAGKNKLKELSRTIDRVESNYGESKSNPITLMKQRMNTESKRRMDTEYFWTEIEEFIIGRRLDSRESYFAVNARKGRGQPMSTRQLEAMWDIHQEFTRWLDFNGWTTWARVRASAATQVETLEESCKYDAIFIDEAQDMDSNISRMLKLLCKSESGIFMAGDLDQSIYGVAVPWSRAHPDIDVRHRPIILTNNYRNSTGIWRAVEYYLSDGGAEETAEQPKQCHIVDSSGRLPVQIRLRRSEDEIAKIQALIGDARAKHGLDLGDCAVLVPSIEYAKEIADVLSKNGLHAKYSTDKQIDLAERGNAKVITQHSAKGLEFAFVIVAGLGQADKWRQDREGADDYREMLNRHRRRLAMSMSRAKDFLYVIVPEKLPTPLTNGMRMDYWEKI